LTIARHLRELYTLEAAFDSGKFPIRKPVVRLNNQESRFSYPMRQILAFIFGIVLSLPSLAIDLPDSRIRQRLVGQWSDVIQGDAVTVKSTDTYVSDGTFAVEGEIHPKDGTPFTVKVDGHWEVKNGVVISTVTRSSDVSLVPVGTITRDRVLLINSKEFHCVTEAGRLSKQLRITD